MTYISKHTLAFRDDSYPPILIRSRSEGRLKKYPSATDARAWCDIREERRQYILDLVTRNHEKGGVGKFVPIEAILRCLLSHKDALIARLQKELDECRAQKGIRKKKGCGRKLPCPKKIGGGLPVSDSDYAKWDEETSDYAGSPPDDGAKLKDKERELEYYKATAIKAIEQLEKLHSIVAERDHLKQEIESLKNRIQDPCAEEIAALEEDIARLRGADRLSSAEEMAVVKKEVEILKKYCKKINKIQEDNYQLQLQVSRLQELSDIPISYEDEPELTNDPGELKSRLTELKRKFAKFNEIMDERDKLQVRVSQLQMELSKYTSLPEEIEDFKKRSAMLDYVAGERDDLKQRLENMKVLEEEIIQLKKKADRAKVLEMKLAQLNVEIGNSRRQSAIELRGLENENRQVSRDAARAKSELVRRDSDLANATSQIDRLSYLTKETDMLRIERDRLKLRLDELAGGDIDYMSDQCRCLNSLKNERDMYKAKYEDLIGLECQCDMLRAQVDGLHALGAEQVASKEQIAQQETDIQKLISEVDRLSKENKEQKERMTKTINELNEKLDQRNNLIAGSKIQLAGMEDELKQTIQNISCETLNLKSRIDELIKQADESDKRIKMYESKLKELEIDIDFKDDQIRSLSQDLVTDRKNSLALEDANKTKEQIIEELRAQINEMKEENAKLVDMVNQGFAKDEHLERILKQSKCAVMRVAELL